MSEIRKVESTQVDERCGKCNTGWMRPTGIQQPTNPPQYEHMCNVCGHKQTYGVRYPYNV